MSAAKKVPAKNAALPKVDKKKSVWVHSLFTDYDIDLFLVGKHFRLYEKMGSHLTAIEGTAGTYFSVWAPNAINVTVVGNFNDWNNTLHPLNKRWDKSGIWEGFIPGIAKGEVYKYFVKGFDESEHLKGDPYARRWSTHRRQPVLFGIPTIPGRIKPGLIKGLRSMLWTSLYRFTKYI